MRRLYVLLETSLWEILDTGVEDGPVSGTSETLGWIQVVKASVFSTLSVSLATAYDLYNSKQKIF